MYAFTLPNTVPIHQSKGDNRETLHRWPLGYVLEGVPIDDLTVGDEACSNPHNLTPNAHQPTILKSVATIIPTLAEP